VRFTGVPHRSSLSKVAAAALLAATSLVGLGSLTGSPSAAAADPLVFGDALSGEWSNWSWNATLNPASTSPVASGTRALGAQITAGYGAVSLRTSPAVDFNNGSISFALHGGTTGVSIIVSVGQDEGNATSSTAVTVTAPANGWATHRLTTAQLGPLARVARLNLQSPTPASFSLDDIRVDPGQVQATTVAPSTIAPTTSEGTITINAGATSGSISNRMWGTNLAFYSGGSSFGDATLRTRSRGMTGLTRYPGTQDSQRWGWASCQLGADVANAIGCTNPNFTWTAKPSDFIGFMQSVGGEALVTVNANATAKENAAFVAFMNGSPTDTRSIGIDQRGADWRTVGYWAQQRVNAGYPTALNVKLWEFGNETYGGLPGNNQCLSYGWEVTWTCKASEFLDGIGTGATRQDGYRASKAAMKAIDSSIQVGFPAERKLDDYTGWTRDAIANHRGDIDFFVVHPYFYWIPPTNDAAGNGQILSLPQRHWKEVSDAFDAGYAQYGSRRVPLIISEFNLTPGRENDPARRMNGMGNAIMMADSVGTMAQDSIFLGANAFDLYNAPGSEGTYFSMMRRDGGFTRNPLYWGWVLWSRFGSAATQTSLLQTTSTFDAANTLSVYAGRRDGNTLSLYVFNKSGRNVSAQIATNGVPGIGAIITDTAAGTSMTDEIATFNGQTNPNNDLSSAPGSVSSANGQRSFIRTFSPWSMTLLRMTIDGTVTATTTATTTAPTTITTTTRPATTLVVTTTTPATTTPATTTPTTIATTTAPTTAAPTTVAQGGTTCRVSYSADWQSTVAFGGNGTITNTGSSPISGWTLAFTFAGNQKIDVSWGSSYSQTGQQVTINNAGWNGLINPGESVGFGYRATYTGSNAAVTGWRLNNLPCSG
jgi:Cellulose binding domain